MYEFPLTPDLSISFQRYPYPPASVVTMLPSSWGALPLHARAPRHLIVPSPRGEAFWIGLIPSLARRPTLVHVLASVASGDWLDVVTGAPSDRSHPKRSTAITVPAQHAISGISCGEGTWWPFARDSCGTNAPACLGLELHSRPGTGAEPGRRPSDPRRLHAGTHQAGRPPPSPPLPPPDEDAGGETESLLIDLVKPGQFETVSGIRLPPLNAANRYGGWRLP